MRAGRLLRLCRQLAARPPPPPPQPAASASSALLHTTTTTAAAGRVLRDARARIPQISHHTETAAAAAAAARPYGSRQPQRPQTLQEHEEACWSCKHHHRRGGLVCQSCDTIQPPDSSLTYYELLGLPAATYDVDPAALERRYKLLQWQLHPDKAVHRTAEEREFSAGQASLINQAYSVLRSPLARANYLLMLEGVPAGEDFEGTIEDPELLMEVLEAREAVEEADDQEQLIALNRQFKQRQADIVERVSAAFAARDLQAAARLTAELTYWVRLEQATQQKL